LSIKEDKSLSIFQTFTTSQVKKMRSLSVGTLSYGGKMIFKKKTSLLALVLMFLVATLVGCSSDSDDEGSTSTGGSVSAIRGTGITWKPVSEGDRKLAVIGPAGASTSTTVAIYRTDGTLVEKGRRSKSHGSRPVFRFSKAGRGYPKPCVLQFGSGRYSIPNPASRYN